MVDARSLIAGAGSFTVDDSSLTVDDSSFRPVVVENSSMIGLSRPLAGKQSSGAESARRRSGAERSIRRVPRSILEPNASLFSRKASLSGSKLSVGARQSSITSPKRHCAARGRSASGARGSLPSRCGRPSGPLRASVERGLRRTSRSRVSIQSVTSDARTCTDAVPV